MTDEPTGENEADGSLADDATSTGDVSSAVGRAGEAARRDRIAGSPDALRSAAMKAMKHEQEGPVDTPPPNPAVVPPVTPPPITAPKVVPPVPPSTTEDAEDSRRWWIIAAAVAALLILAGLGVIVAGGSSGSNEGDAIKTEGRVDISETGATTTSTPDAPESTAVPATTPVDATAVTETSVAAPAPGASTTVVSTTTTSPPPPADFSVQWPRDSLDRMVLLAGSKSAVTLSNSGGMAGNYVVSPSGDVSVGANASGTVEPGGFVQVQITAGPTKGEGMVTVSADGHTLATIEIIIT